MSDAEGISRWLSKMFSILVDSVIKLKIAEKKKKKEESVECITCNGNHPTPLHDFNESINVVTMAEVRIAKNGSSVGKFQCRIGASDCEVLIDSGADVSIISGNLVATRNRRTSTPIKLCGFDNAMYRIANQRMG